MMIGDAGLGFDFAWSGLTWSGSVLHT